jgi:hypothetical protein
MRMMTQANSEILEYIKQDKALLQGRANKLSSGEKECDLPLSPVVK